MAIILRIVCGLWRNVVTLSMLSPLSPSILFRFLFDEGMATKSSFRGGWEGRGRLRKTKGFFRSLPRLLYSNFRRTKISSINLFQQFQGISSLENLFWIFGTNYHPNLVPRVLLGTRLVPPTLSRGDHIGYDVCKTKRGLRFP